MRYAIVGFGTAGYHAVEAIRETDTEGVIDVYGDTGLAPYNPMLTTYYACGKVDKSGMFPFGSLEQIQKPFGFNFRKQLLSERRMIFKFVHHGCKSCNWRIL